MIIWRLGAWGALISDLTYKPLPSINLDLPLDLNRISKRGDSQMCPEPGGGQPVGDLKSLNIFWGLINCHKLGDLTVMQLSHENV